MRILLTGVTGQVGAALAAPLAQIGSVIAADRTLLDLSKPEAVASALDAIAPDIIVNPAAYTAVDRAEDERELAFRVNAESPGAMARWAATRGVPLIHFSTDYVFDGSGGRPWREDDATVPLSAYGASKLAGEDAIRAAGVPHLIIRTCWVYAAAGSNFMLTMARLAREREQLRVVADQIGAPTSARLIADVVTRIVEHLGADPGKRLAAAGGVLNVAASSETSWHGFASAIIDGLRARGIPLRVQTVIPICTADYPTKARRPANSRLDLARLQTVFGIATPIWTEVLAPELDKLALAWEVNP